MTAALDYRVYKYPVPIEDAFTVTMPSAASILDVQVQHGEPVMWALVNTQAPTVERRFRVVGTGHPIDADEAYRLIHIGSFQHHGGALVFHLFEVHA